ncbi:hypothetical protein [Flagellimonas flava]|uniref:hypothetical protein n=1 Tax=Flagellimonas flava TaxID=570519 RepID=UPI003D65DBD3
MDRHINFLDLYFGLYIAQPVEEYQREAFRKKIVQYLEQNPEIIEEIKLRVKGTYNYSEQFFTSYLKKAYFEGTIKEFILILKT